MNASVSTSSAKGRVVCYMAGGTAVNISKVLAEQFKKLDLAPAAQIEVVLIDTSDSNLVNGASDKIYLLKGLDGSGKLRAENHPAISRAILGILDAHQPGDLNIVVSSLGGGSGSVIAPALAGALLAQDKLVIGMGVTNTDSAIEVTNSVKTIKSYESIAKKIGKPIVLSLFKNSAADSFQKINEAIVSNIIMLSVLASRKNIGLDSADLRNWLYYNRVSKAPIKAMTLDITHSESVELPEGAHPITTATLAREGASTRLNWTPDYQCVGYVSTDGEKKGNFDKPLHFTVCDGELDQIFKELDELEKKLTAKAAAHQYTPGTLSGNEDVQDDGTVL